MRGIRVKNRCKKFPKRGKLQTKGRGKISLGGHNIAYLDRNRPHTAQAGPLRSQAKPEESETKV